MKKLLQEKRIEISYLLTSIFVVFFCKSYFFEQTSFLGVGFGFIFIVLATIILVNCAFILWESRCKEYAYIVAGGMISSFPFWTQNFMYGDDLWVFQSSIYTDPKVTVALSRPFFEFWVIFLRKNDFRDIRYLRIYVCVWFLLFGLLVYAMLRKLNANKYMSLVWGIVCSSSLSVIDCIGYASVFPIAIALVCTVISFLLFSGLYTIHNIRIVSLIESAACLLMAFSCYQIATPFFFVCYYIWLVERKEIASFKNELKRFLIDMLYFAVNGIVYLLMTKSLQYFGGIKNGQSARSEFTLSPIFFVNKISWFIRNIVPQALSDVFAIFCGNRFFEESNLFYNNTFKISFLKNIVIILFLISFWGFVFQYFKKKKSFFGIILSVIVPFLAYYPFLVLPQYEYYTYYALSLILLLSWFGISFCFQILSKQNRNIIVCTVFTVIVSLIIVMQANNYAQNVWVNYNSYRYSYLKNELSIELKKNPNIDSIIVEGDISPYVGGHAYVIFSVEDALIELGYDYQDYDIYQQQNEYYVDTIQYEEYLQLKERLSKEQLKKLLSYYTENVYYSLWQLTTDQLSDADLDFLKETLQTGGLLCCPNENTLYINLNELYGLLSEEPF